MRANFFWEPGKAFISVNLTVPGAADFTLRQ
jgi:hypothetical protein